MSLEKSVLNIHKMREILSKEYGFQLIDSERLTLGGKLLQGSLQRGRIKKLCLALRSGKPTSAGKSIGRQRRYRNA